MSAETVPPAPSSFSRDHARSQARGIAESVVYSCGGGRVLCVGAHSYHLVKHLVAMGIDARGIDTAGVEETEEFLPGRMTAAQLPILPFADDQFDVTVISDCLEFLNDDALSAMMQEVRRVTRRAVYLRIATVGASTTDSPTIQQSRIWWESRFFAEGFRKHPLYYRVVDYAGLEHEGRSITILLESVPDAALKAYPLEALREERDLHMDMMREPGERSDAHIVRYQWATGLVRPGDVVLDAACGLGYGSYLIQSATKARRTIGIDGSAYATEYANLNFATVIPGLEFRCGYLPDALKDIPDCSIDLVLSFETLEHVENNIELLAEFRRVLTPGGRIAVSIPNDWTDEETGVDPNPYHVHVYKLGRLRDEISSQFVLEKLTAQSASRHKSGPGRRSWVEAQRSLTDVAPDIAEEEAPDAEWWLAVAMRSPLDGAGLPFRETQFPAFDDPSWNVTTFGRDYDNPWLVRGMVDVTHRLQNRSELIKLGEQVLQGSAANSPDVGAALTVLGYQMLSSGEATESDVSAFAARVGKYLDATPATPHGVRWTVSLWFLLGRQWMTLGMFEKAVDAFENCVKVDPLSFSPLLANRSVEAHLILGLLAVRDDKERAAMQWRAGIHLARRAVTADERSSLGNPDSPAEFGLPELASILDYASSCAYALLGLPDFDHRPLWWFEPRRERISQSSSQMPVSRQAQVYKDTIDQYIATVKIHEEELAAYERQAKEYARQIEASNEVSQKELAAYRQQADEHVEQLAAARATISSSRSGRSRLRKWLRSRRMEWRARIAGSGLGSRDPIGSEASRTLEGGAFDPAEYLRIYPDVAAAGVDPLVHWQTRGKREGRLGRLDPRLKPFDPDFYLDVNADLRLAKVNPYEHWTRHGHAEGRPGAPPELLFVDGPLKFDPAKKTLMVVSHEASRTGAPILCLNLSKRLSAHFNIVNVLLGGGVLLKDFINASHLTVYATNNSQTAGAFYVRRVLERIQIDCALVNSVVSHSVLPQLAQSAVPSICLVHEFASYVWPTSIMESIALWSSEVVFSAPIILRDAQANLPGWRSEGMVHILPQGRCASASKVADKNESAMLQQAFRPKGSPTGLKVVLGVGSVNLRKGVDIFLQCAAAVVARSATKNVRFVWIGGGYDPDNDMGYSVYLREQIRRSKLEDHVAIIGEVGDIETAYREADVMLLTSRLDPLPNVSIDAVSVGLPIVCFDDASGAADLLKASGLESECVVPYLDSDAMAGAVSRLLEDEEAYADLQRRLPDVAARWFDMGKYVDRLEELLAAATSRTVRDEAVVDSVIASGRFDLDLWNRETGSCHDLRTAVQAYLRVKERGVAPFAGVPDMRLD